MSQDELVSVRAELQRKLVIVVRNLLDALTVNEQLQQALAAADSAGAAAFGDGHLDDLFAAPALATARQSAPTDASSLD